MNKEELEQKISSMEKELSNLKEQIKLCKGNQGKIWQPKEGEHYWFIDANSMLVEIDMVVEMYIQNGNYFRTQEEARKQAEYNLVMNRFRKYVEAYSEPLDWNNINQCKYTVAFDYVNKTIIYMRSWLTGFPFQIYASSEEVLKNAIIYSAGSEENFIKVIFNEKKL